MVRRFDAVMHDVSAPCLAIARAIRFRCEVIGCRWAALPFLKAEFQFRFLHLFRSVARWRDVADGRRLPGHPLPDLSQARQNCEAPW